MRLCALLETSDGEYHICCGQFSSFRLWSLLLSNLKLGSRSLDAMMDLMRNRANFALTDSVYKSRSIAQGQDSERKSSNFLNVTGIHQHRAHNWSDLTFTYQ
jgi:hypothetical protein